MGIEEKILNLLDDAPGFTNFNLQIRKRGNGVFCRLNYLAPYGASYKEVWADTLEQAVNKLSVQNFPYEPPDFQQPEFV